MTHPEQIQETLHRVEIGQQTDEDIKFLRQLLLASDRQLSIQLGKLQCQYWGREGDTYRRSHLQPVG